MRYYIERSDAAVFKTFMFSLAIIVTAVVISVETLREENLYVKGSVMDNTFGTNHGE